MELGRWPRRLIHVPSMTSYEWQPGNKYGNCIEPTYNVVSYTWGRFELRGHTMPEVEAVRLHGLTWDVPRIDPTHFSELDFRRLIQKSTTFRSRKEGDEPKATGPMPEHLWLDIACIDQKDEATKISEIGRQATIFRHAETALVWLTRHSNEQLAFAVDKFAEYIGEMDFDVTTMSIKSAVEALELLLTDPWFSSLWTLQEAFLRKDGILLSTQGEYVSFREYSAIDLRFLTVCCHPLSRVSVSTIQEALHIDEAENIMRLKDTIQESGLGLLHSDNPVTLYTGARFRKTRYQLDRIYGIMQTFDLRLGSAAEGAEHKNFTLLELEDQLGTALMETWPVRSQFHIHTKPAMFGRAWRVSDSSEFPAEFPDDPNELIKDEKNDEDFSQCRLSTRKVDKVTWGVFKGKICRFEYLAAAWKLWSIHNSWRASPLQCVALDATDALREAPSTLHALNQLAVPLNETQHEVCSTLVHMFGDNLVILALGLDKGLILIRRQTGGFSYWHRIGVCFWAAKETDDAFVLCRKTCQWSELEGFFG